MYRLTTYPDRTRWIATIYPCISYTEVREEALGYADRSVAIQTGRDLRSQGHHVIALPDEEKDVENSTDRVGSLNPLLLPAPCHSVSEAGPLIPSHEPTLPANDGRLDGETVPTTDTATTNAVCSIPTPRKRITESLMTILGVSHEKEQ